MRGRDIRAQRHQVRDLKERGAEQPPVDLVAAMVGALVQARIEKRDRTAPLPVETPPESAALQTLRHVAVVIQTDTAATHAIDKAKASSR